MSYHISLASEADAPAIAAIYAPYVKNTPISFEYEPPNSEEIASRIRKIREAELPWIVARDESGQILGYAYAAKHKDRAGYEWSVESSVYVDSAAHRSGIGRALYTRLFEILRALGYYNVYAGATLPNEQSEKFHQSFGFEVAGKYPSIGFKHGRWHDTVWWRMALAPYPEFPLRPRKLSEVLQTEAVWQQR